ncbi:MAG: helix-turn-helix domain-containing protein [Bacteroidetes bacterium]|nr:helix-turn-helix domain-containing protein [Bacteroidota bacterium]
MHAQDPVIVCTKSALTRAVAAAVEEGVSRFSKKQLEANESKPTFGWVTNVRAMQLLGLSRPTLARYRKRGMLPYSKVGSTVYYRLEDIEALLESRRVRPRG